MSSRITGLGELLREARKILQLTLDNMGQYGVSRATWARFEKGEAVDSTTLSVILAKMRERAERMDKDERRGAKEPPPETATYVYRVGEVVRQIVAVVSDQIVGPPRPVFGDPLRLLDRTEIIELTRAWKTPVGDVQTAEFKSREGNAFEANSILEKIRLAQLQELFRTCLSQGDNWFRNFEFDRAITPWTQAVALIPSDSRARLALAKASLYARSGDPVANWQRAFEILSEPIDPGSPEFAEWQAWLGAAWIRHPTESLTEKREQAAKYLRVALKAPSDVHALDRAVWESNLGVILFSTGDPAHQQTAQRLFEGTLEAWQESERPYERGMALRRLGNFWLLRPEANERQRRKNLEQSWSYFERACQAFRAEQFAVELAQTEYSWADTEMALAEVDGEPADQHFAAAEKLCRQAIQRLTIANAEDWGKAQYNLARTLHTRPHPTAENLLDATQAYRETLKIYTRDFQPTEWSETHLPLSFALEALWLNTKKPEFLREAIASAKATLQVDKRFANYQAYKDRCKSLKAAYLKTPDARRHPFDSIPPAV